MNNNLLENSQLETYNTAEDISDNLCAICLEPLYAHNFEMISPPGDQGSDIELSDNELVDIELSSGYTSRQNSIGELWICSNCNNAFHFECINKWKKNKEFFKCPTCRQQHSLGIIIVNTNITTDPDKDTCVHPIIYVLVTFILSFAALFIIKFIFVEYT